MNIGTNSGYSDIRGGTWVDRLPGGWQPYAQLARLDRPIGWWLLLLPCWWALALAPVNPAPWGMFVMFWIGAVVMRGAGCTLNDLADREIDAQVERTRVRPIPSGRVSPFQAMLFLSFQLAIGAVVLWQLNWASIYLGFFVLALIATYPFMKRITFWPQFFLGLNFNWGALMGWTAITGHVSGPAIALYVAGIAWTLGYDTIYAHQDKADDVTVGVKSTALLFGAKSRIWVAGFYAVTALGVLAAFRLAEGGSWAYVAWVALVIHLAWQVRDWKMDDQADCLAKFKSNRDAGLIIAIGCLLAAH